MNTQKNRPNAANLAMARKMAQDLANKSGKEAFLIYEDNGSLFISPVDYNDGRPTEVFHSQDAMEKALASAALYHLANRKIYWGMNPEEAYLEAEQELQAKGECK